MSALPKSTPETTVEMAPAKAAATKATITTQRDDKPLDLPTLLKRIASEFGRAPNQVVAELARLAFGPGKLSIDEYFAMRLFDDKGLGGTDKRAFLGLDAMRRVWMKANYNQEWWGIMREKLAITSLLGAYGFPVIPTLALYSNVMRMPSTRMLTSRETLKAFLLEGANYPIFGKPMDEKQSLGTASLVGVEAASGTLSTIGGEKLEIEDYLDTITEKYGQGYIFQKRVVPHADVRAIAGDRLATVRVMTILTAKGPELLRAAWKIPAGANAADNFWRPGNLLCTLDLSTGMVLRCVSGGGLTQKEHAEHPDSGARITGIKVPMWEELVGVALEAARTLKDTPLIGWDMAATDAGALIVEPNFTPDFILPQIADRRGMMDERMKAFLAECEASARDAKSKMRQMAVDELKTALARIARSTTGT
jgi:hypothetical protein